MIRFDNDNNSDLETDNEYARRIHRDVFRGRKYEIPDAEHEEEKNFNGNNKNNKQNFSEIKEEEDEEIRVIEESKLEQINNDNENTSQQQQQQQPSQSEILVDLIKENSLLFKDEFSVPFALVDIDGHYEVLQIESKKFRRYLSKKYYDTFDNKIPNSENIKNAIQILEAEAIFKGQTISLHLRTAWTDKERKGSIYYDLTNYKNRYVKITPDNWKIVNNQTEILY